jgi:uncharacterized membrane protein
MSRRMDDVVLVLGFIVTILIITAVVKVLWNLSGLLGLVFIFVAIFLILKKHGNVTLAKNQPYLLFLSLGLFFLFLSYAVGIEIVDLTGIANPLETLLP